MENKDRIYGQGLNLITILLIGIFILSILFGIYSYISKTRLISEKTGKENSVIAMKNQIKSMEEKSLPQLVSANELKKRLDSEIKWSEAIKKISSITPKEVFYRSYSANKSGNISLAALTSGVDKITTLIDTMTKTNYLSDVFIPTISKGTNSSGQTEYSFSLELNYDESTEIKNEKN